MRKFYQLRKTYMTLLETLIAVSLLSMMLVFVFGFFRELAEISRLTEKSQKESFQMRYLESRLNFIFERIVNENQQKNKVRLFCFYTEPTNRSFSPFPSLIFTFNNEVRSDPAYSGDVLARLYVDLNNQLCLVTWPLHVEEPHQYMQKEVLMTQIEEISYGFYSPPAAIGAAKEITSGKDIDPEKKRPEKDKWHDINEWALTYEQMPSILRLNLKVTDKDNAKKEARKLEFYFVLPSSKNPVQYPME